MVWHRFLFPAVHLVPPFHPFFPSHTFFFPFLFMSFLPSCLVISSFFSFAHTLVRPLAYSRTTSSGVLGRPGYYKEVKFIVCPWSLGFFSSQPHALGLSCPPLMSSSFRPSSACMCASVGALNAVPSIGRALCVCVCVCV